MLNKTIEILGLPKAVIKTSGNIVNDLSIGLAKTIGGLSLGLKEVAETAGKTIDNMSKHVAITSTKVFRNVGDLGMNIAKQLGNVVEIIPVLGKPTAYVVKGTGKGVYYVVTSVGNVAGKGLKTIGKLGKEASNVVVFTLVSTSDLTEDLLKEAGLTVKKVSELVNNKKKRRKSKTMKKRKSKKGKKGRKTRK